MDHPVKPSESALNVREPRALIENIARQAPRRAAPSLERVAFRTSRLIEFCSKKELVAQTGHGVWEWPLVLLKETLDNSLDAAEEARLAPEIAIDVSTETGEIVISDNGPGIPAEVIADILDYSVRVSSREAYVSPSRGAQGNALKTLLAMPLALDGNAGMTVIESRGVRHVISFAVDRLRQEPVIKHEPIPDASVKTGTRVTLRWPESACSVLTDAEPRFLQIADDFGWFNPHLSIRVVWDGAERVNRAPSDPGWDKWRPSDPTSACWYDLARLERYLAAHVARDQDHGRDRTVRDFIAELRGFSGSAKQKRVLEETGLARAPLSSLFGPDGSPKGYAITELLEALQRHSKPVKPQDLGLIGRAHLLARFQEAGVEVESFKYRKDVDVADDGLPWVVETAFGWCPAVERRRIITGVNWSVAIGNPFRSFGRDGEGLESLLAQQWAGAAEPVVFVTHYCCPRVSYTDRGKSAIAFGEV